MTHVTIANNSSLAVSTINIPYFNTGTFCIIILVLTITILFSNRQAIDYILDTEQDLIERNRKPDYSMNMLYTEIPRDPNVNSGRRSLFLFDCKDITGTQLAVLFAGKNYTPHNAMGYKGYVFTDQTSRVRL